MPYEASIEVREDHLRVSVTGTRRLGDAASDAGDVGARVVGACREHGIYRVLLLLNLSGRLSAFDSYEMVANARDYGWTHAFRLAIVDSNPRSMVDSEFTETIAVNRAYGVKAFRNEDEALQWLLAGPD
jgi:hypothetical protein